MGNENHIVNMQSPQHIVIIGGGIIGCTTAYYLTRHPSYSRTKAQITILEASSVAGGASGKAGGLVAKWAYPRELVNITFHEHENLAKEHNGAERWGWRYTNCGQWEGRGEDPGHAADMSAQTNLEKKGGLFGPKASTLGAPWHLQAAVDTGRPRTCSILKVDVLRIAEMLRPRPG